MGVHKWRVTMSERVQQIIQSNLDLIYSGFYRDHEHLDKLFKKVPTFGVHLAAMYTWMKDHPAPFVTDKKENEYWSMPMSALIALHGGTAETWQSHIILMHLLGLLKRSRPDKRSVLPEMKKAYVKAIENHQRSMSFYSPVEFNAKTIDAAEQEAKKIIESGMSAGHITKADIIRHYGKSMANRLYADLRKVSGEEQHVLDVMVEVIRSNVRRSGYTVPDEVICFSRCTRCMRKRETTRICVTAISDWSRSIWSARRIFAQWQGACIGSRPKRIMSDWEQPKTSGSL